MAKQCLIEKQKKKPTAFLSSKTPTPPPPPPPPPPLLLIFSSGIANDQSLDADSDSVPSNNIRVKSNRAVSLNVWYNLAFSYDDDLHQMMIYIDGVPALNRDQVGHACVECTLC